MNTYHFQNETGKVHLCFDYADYQALSPEIKSKIKSAFLWARSAGAWVSRTKFPNNWRAEGIAKELNLEYKGERGEKLTFAEQKEREQVKAGARVERFEARAEKKENESQSQYERSHNLVSVIPMGQPILIGHHSERGHRNLLKKADNAMRKSCEADEKAKYYKGRAEASKRTVEGAKFKSVDYLLNRISECKADLRAIEKSLAGKDMRDKATGELFVNGCEISEERHIFLEGRKSEQLEKLDFFFTKLQEAGGGQMTAERMKQGKPAYVNCGGTWYPLKSINRDTVTVLNWLRIASFTWKYKFDQIKEMQPLHGTVIVHDKHGNEVKPIIKHAEV